MSVIEDVRHRSEDFVAPEIKWTGAPVTVMAQEMRAGFGDTKAAPARLESQIGLAQPLDAFRERLSRMEAQKPQH